MHYLLSKQSPPMYPWQQGLLQEVPHSGGVLALAMYHIGLYYHISFVLTCTYYSTY